MKTLFVDTFYWVALINVADSWHQTVRNYSRNLNNIKLVTTEEVLIETINFFASFPSPMKKAVFRLITQVIADQNITIISQSHESFTGGLELFSQRFDKGYSLTDCISMVTMNQLNITEVLTHDKHFQQEGFIILFKQS
ncbi:type II toxin-antitoxin system VapC family toxin [Planktothrix sp. FACHB-1365]|uniref:type II toxin-antitoxin system VapC family toxin n=1 Tax=Planktothrix sp. FACHB-1365 TaxID=2692855 RepID=UPI0016828423|nr:PIN domain-containing protein [Planktothrix sp. FACHB-1365]MBD2481450.1 type II toxin-antitoxin system VapC family toxin [Planktothrix sp. FACHB-1365]